MPLFEVDATAVEPIFKKLYSYTFDVDGMGSSTEEGMGSSTEDMDRPAPIAIFVINFDKVGSNKQYSFFSFSSMLAF